MNKDYDYSLFFHSPDLLAKEILKQYVNTIEKISYPIDPFKILKNLNVQVVMKEFKDVEGLFIPAEFENDIDIVAINQRRSLFRQRFTAAHEICHVIKDKENTVVCPIAGKRDSIEKFADNFAAYLLMPLGELKTQVDRYIENGYIPLKQAIHVAEYFGVSFEMCVFNIAYKLNKIDGDIDPKELKKRIKRLKPDALRKEIIKDNNCNLTDINILRNQIDSYCYFMPKYNQATRIKLKQYLLVNENRLEGVDISEEEINYMLADIRNNNDYDKYQDSKNINVLQALGNIELIDYVLNTDKKFDIWKIFDMQKLLFKYTPYGKDMNQLRQCNNRVTGAEMCTVDYTQVLSELGKLDKQIQELLSKINYLTIAEYVRECVKIHHRFTIIHPFNDGNGRISRTILIWLFKLKKLPPIYIESEYKEDYLNGLNKIDKDANYDTLEFLFLKQILRSLIILDEKLFLNNEDKENE